jgi:cell shape-determining protein MreD
LANLLSIPVLLIVVILQTTVASRLPLLNGTVDLVLLTLTAWSLQERVTSAWVWTLVGGVMVSFISALPSFTPLVGYLLVTWVARLLQRRVWQTPILALFVATFLGTLILHGLTITVLLFTGRSFDWRQALNMITLPSVLLNMLLVLPVHAIMGDLAQRAYPTELNV